MLEQHRRIALTVVTLTLAVAGPHACAGAAQQAPSPPPAAPPPPATNAATPESTETPADAATPETTTATTPTEDAAVATSDAGTTDDAAVTTTDAATTAPAYSGPPPYVSLRPPRVSPGISPEAITRVWRRNQPAIVQCYTTQLATNPRAHGVLTARIEIIAGGTGTIERLQMTPRNEAMEACIREALARFEWPNPRGQPSTEVNLQVDFAPTPPAPSRR